MKVPKILLSTFSFFILIAGFLRGQTPTTCTAYLWYNISTAETTAFATPYFGGKIFPAFTKDDYSKMLQISAQRIWKMTSGGDTIWSYDYNYGMRPFFNPDRSVFSTRSLNANDFKNDATVMGPTWPEDLYGMSGDLLVPVKPHNYFKIQNGYAEDGGGRVKMGKDLRFIISTDSQMIADKKGDLKLKVATNYLDPANLTLGFVEKWSFDPLTGIFQKQVNGVGYLRLLSDPSNGEKIGYSPYLFLDNPNGIYNPKVDLPLKKNVIIEESVKSEELRFAYDSMERTYTPEEAIERLQYGNNNIPSYERVKFLSALFYYAFQNPTKVFPEKNNVVDSLHPYLNKNSLLDIFHQVDTSNEVEDPMNPGTFIHAPIIFDVQLGNVYAIRFYEDWYYDPNTLTIQKRVNGIGFLLMEYDINNFPRFKDAGIYIKMN